MTVSSIAPADILIVDDTPANLEMLSSILARRGYKVRPAIGGEVALTAARAQRPDLILLDIRMPEMDGYEVCERFKADELTMDIPIIFISALDAATDKVRAFQVGGVDYVTKPFQVEEVVARIETHLVIARQKREIEQLREKDRQHFEALNRIKDEFVNTASHDLKSPIGTVLGYVKMLAEHPCILGDEEALFFIDKISAGAERALNLTSDLLDLAQMEAGVALTRENLSAAGFLEQCVYTVDYLARTRQITLTYEPPPEDIIINIDKRKMTQVMNNLLTNALKYTPENGQVDVTAGREDNHLFIRIADTGVGIPAADIPRIFEKFYRVPRRDYIEIEGTGLGLAIARSIVEAHGGVIWAESPNETGTTFCVQLEIEEG